MGFIRRVNKKEAILNGLPWYTIGHVIKGKEFHGYRENMKGSIAPIYKKIGSHKASAERSKNRAEKNREFASRVKKILGCAFCGYKTNAVALHFDHIDRQKKSGIISLMVNGSRQRLKNEMKKCQVLCANCHAIKTHTQKEHS